MEGEIQSRAWYSAVSAITKIVSSDQADKGTLSIAATYRGLIWVPDYSSGSSVRFVCSPGEAALLMRGLGGLTIVPPRNGACSILARSRYAIAGGV
jgi:hypothetical protein